MTKVSGFPPIARKDAKVLILGSMPGVESLRQQQYYAHPRNSFWHIMGALFDFNDQLTYAKRVTALKNNQVALWDVLNTCIRPGSLDASIDADSVIVNDFADFFMRHPRIQSVFFNGGMAEQQYHKQVLQDVNEQGITLEYQRLPSTSPAHAAMTVEQKLQKWHTVVDAIHQTA